MNTKYRLSEQVGAWTLVTVQLTLLAGLVLAPGERAWSTPGWLVVLAAGMVITGAALGVAAALRLGAGFTASPLPARAAVLRTTGAYACVRHPIYTGLLLGGAGVVLLGGRPIRIWIWLGLLGVLWFKTVIEERKLTARFPDYPAYAAGTPRLLPRPWRCLAGFVDRRAA